MTHSLKEPPSAAATFHPLSWPVPPGLTACTDPKLMFEPFPQRPMHRQQQQQLPAPPGLTASTDPTHMFEPFPQRLMHRQQQHHPGAPQDDETVRHEIEVLKMENSSMRDLLQDVQRKIAEMTQDRRCCADIAEAMAAAAKVTQAAAAAAAKATQAASEASHSARTALAAVVQAQNEAVAASASAEKAHEFVHVVQRTQDGYQ